MDSKKGAAMSQEERDFLWIFLGIVLVTAANITFVLSTGTGSPL